MLKNNNRKVDSIKSKTLNYLAQRRLARQQMEGTIRCVIRIYSRRSLNQYFHLAMLSRVSLADGIERERERRSSKYHSVLLASVRNFIGKMGKNRVFHCSVYVQLTTATTTALSCLWRAIISSFLFFSLPFFHAQSFAFLLWLNLCINLIRYIYTTADRITISFAIYDLPKKNESKRFFFSNSKPILPWFLTLSMRSV